jgi:putative addiction module component (TIGR02574 family)
MTEKIAELLKQAMELPPEGRAALASSLLASLDDNVVDEGAELEWEREIARRVDELNAGTVATIPWAEVRQRALARINGPRR